MSERTAAFKTIGEVQKLLGEAQHTLRYWEAQFPQVNPVRSTSGRRLYRPSDVRFLQGLQFLLRERGLTRIGVRRLIARRGVDYVAGLARRNSIVEDNEVEKGPSTGFQSQEAVPEEIKDSGKPEEQDSGPAVSAPSPPLSPATAAKVKDPLPSGKLGLQCPQDDENAIVRATDRQSPSDVAGSPGCPPETASPQDSRVPSSTIAESEQRTAVSEGGRAGALEDTLCQMNLKVQQDRVEPTSKSGVSVEGSEAGFGGADASRAAEVVERLKACIAELRTRDLSQSQRQQIRVLRKRLVRLRTQIASCT